MSTLSAPVPSDFMLETLLIAFGAPEPGISEDGEVMLRRAERALGVYLFTAALLSDASLARDAALLAAITGAPTCVPPLAVRADADGTRYEGVAARCASDLVVYLCAALEPGDAAAEHLERAQRAFCTSVARLPELSELRGRCVDGGDEQSHQAQCARTVAAQFVRSSVDRLFDADAAGQRVRAPASALWRAPDRVLSYHVFVDARVPEPRAAATDALARGGTVIECASGHVVCTLDACVAAVGRMYDAFARSARAKKHAACRVTAAVDAPPWLRPLYAHCAAVARFGASVFGASQTQRAELIDTAQRRFPDLFDCEAPPGAPLPPVRARGGKGALMVDLVAGGDEGGSDTETDGAAAVKDKPVPPPRRRKRGGAAPKPKRPPPKPNPLAEQMAASALKAARDFEARRHEEEQMRRFTTATQALRDNVARLEADKERLEEQLERSKAKQQQLTQDLGVLYEYKRRCTEGGARAYPNRPSTQMYTGNGF